MESAVASEIVSWWKLFTSSMCVCASSPCSWFCCSDAAGGPTLGPQLVLFVGSPLRPADVDAELLGRAEDVLVELPHLDLLARLREDLDVDAQGLHLLDEDLEALGD